MSMRHRTALDTLYPRWGLPGAGGPVDLPAAFGRTAPVVLEIGSGSGEAALAMAASDPERDYLAVEVHSPGVANLLWDIEETGAPNLRVHAGDATLLLHESLPPGCLDAVHVFFPDPWPKARHHKRRIIQPRLAGLIASRLRPGGTLACATDWAEYAESMLATLSAEPSLVNRHAEFAPRHPRRPVTRFEQRGIDAGRTIFDLEFTRIGSASA